MMDARGMKALVTGGTGFIGSHLVDCLLENGRNVRVFSRKTAIPLRWEQAGVEVFRGDLEDPASVLEAMEGIDLFYHAGEIKNITRLSADKNIRLVEAITENLGGKQIKRMVFVSSLTVAGIPSEIPAAEGTRPEIVFSDHYTVYKRKCEELLSTMPAGCECVIVRPAPVYGPGSRYLGRLVEAIGKVGPLGFPFVGNARNIAPLIYVKDLAKALFLSGTRDGISGRTFNLTDGLRHSWADFFQEIANNLNTRLRIVPIPAILLKLPAVPFDLLSGILGIELDPVHYLNYFSRDIYFDNSLAAQLLGWRPEFGLTAGVREMVNSYRSRETALSH
jgi:nucleoside-diphosphate-sugar epimerase